MAVANINLKWLTLIIFSAIFLFSQPVAMAKDDCGYPGARWNQDQTTTPTKTLNPLFQCYSSKPADYSTLYTHIDASSYNWGDGCLYCLRRADCQDIGGTCDPSEHPDWTKVVQFRCAGGNDRTCRVETAVIQQNTAQGQCNLYRARTCADIGPNYVEASDDDYMTWCRGKTPIRVPGLEECCTVVCCCPKPLPPPPKYDITPSDCCKQIVPDIGDPATSEYSLNHLVLIAINVYECILCIVGALILLMLVAGAFILLTSAGSENRVGLGKKIISGAVIGGLLVFFSFLIVNFTVKALGGSFTDEAKVQINPGR